MAVVFANELAVEVEGFVVDTPEKAKYGSVGEPALPPGVEVGGAWQFYLLPSLRVEAELLLRERQLFL